MEFVPSILSEQARYREHVDGEFWADAVRDLALLIAGGLLTLAGGWISNRAAVKREREARAAAEQSAAATRDREAVERVRLLVFDLYLEGRAWQDAGATGVLRFDERKFHDAQLSAELIVDSSTRARLRQTFLIAKNAEQLATGRSGPLSPGHTRTTAMFHATRLLSAQLRGAAPDEKDLKFLENQAWFALKRAKQPRGNDATP